MGRRILRAGGNFCVSRSGAGGACRRGAQDEQGKQGERKRRRRQQAKTRSHYAPAPPRLYGAPGVTGSR
jgi:hypothetical protein